MKKVRSDTVAPLAAPSTPKRVWTTPTVIHSLVDETAKGVYPVEAGSFRSGVPVYFGPS